MWNKRGPQPLASGCANDACSMSALPGNPHHASVPSAFAALPLWKIARVLGHLPHTLNITTGWRVGPSAAGFGHRLQLRLSAQKVCRSALNSCRRQFWQQQTATEHGMEFWDKCMHGHTPYHAMDSREHGPRPPGHQSRVSMHDGPKAKLATLISNVMQTKQTHKAQPLSLDQEARHACQCNAN